MSWLNKLQNRWKLDSIGQVIIVLVVFTCTGFTVMFLKSPVIDFFTHNGDTDIWFTVVYYILILPIYNVFLLLYGFIFGQFTFFWEFEKRMWKRMTGRKSHAE